MWGALDFYHASRIRHHGTRETSAWVSLRADIIITLGLTPGGEGAPLHHRCAGVRHFTVGLPDQSADEVIRVWTTRVSLQSHRMCLLLHTHPPPTQNGVLQVPYKIITPLNLNSQVLVDFDVFYLSAENHKNRCRIGGDAIRNPSKGREARIDIAQAYILLLVSFILYSHP